MICLLLEGVLQLQILAPQQVHLLEHLPNQLILKLELVRPVMVHLSPILQDHVCKLKLFFSLFCAFQTPDGLTEQCQRALDVVRIDENCLLRCNTCRFVKLHNDAA